MQRRSTARVFITLLLIAFSISAWASNQESLEELISRADNARVEDCPALCTEVAERELKSADQLYHSGENDKARAALQEVVTYSQKAHDACLQSSKRLKNTEIALRKMAAKLRDIKHTLAFADQEPVQSAADKLESMRTDLLKEMFPKDRH